MYGMLLRRFSDPAAPEGVPWRLGLSPALLSLVLVCLYRMQGPSLSGAYTEGVL